MLSFRGGWEVCGEGLRFFDKAAEQQQHDGPNEGGERATDQPRLDGERGQTEQEAAAEGAEQPGLENRLS
ncbi:MAG: hypothetical protein R6X17_07165 [Candidatus Competibacteraceae bacterium]